MPRRFVRYGNILQNFCGTLGWSNCPGHCGGYSCTQWSFNCAPARKSKPMQRSGRMKVHPLAGDQQKTGSGIAGRAGKVLCRQGKGHSGNALWSAAHRFCPAGISSVQCAQGSGVSVYTRSIRATTTASTFDALAKEFARLRWLPEIRTSEQFTRRSPSILMPVLYRSSRTGRQGSPQPEAAVFLSRVAEKEPVAGRPLSLRVPAHGSVDLAAAGPQGR